MRQVAHVKNITPSFFLWLPTLLAVAPPTGAVWAQHFELKSDPGRVTITAGNRPVLVYRFDNVPAKPYVQEVHTPGGVNVLRDAPKDHLHHHGLMFAVGVDGISFWTEGGRSGRQQHQGFAAQRVESRNGTSRAVLAESLQWLGPESDEALLSESRVIEVRRASDLPATLLTWETRLTAPEGRQRVLGGSHYYGLGMRFFEEMDRNGVMLNSTGEQGDPVRGSERLVQAKWVAYTATVDGKPVTAALFDHPQNPRSPARMFTMTTPFAYLSATMNLWKESFTIEGGQTCSFRYGIAICDGRLSPEQVERLYKHWQRQDKLPVGTVTNEDR